MSEGSVQGASVWALDINGIAGHICKISCDGSWTVADLKKHLVGKAGVMIAQQTIIMGCMALDDTDVLMERVLSKGVLELTLYTKSPEQCLYDILEMDDAYQSTFETWLHSEGQSEDLGIAEGTAEERMLEVALAATSEVLRAILAGNRFYLPGLWHDVWGPMPPQRKPFETRRILPGCCSMQMTLCASTKAFLQDGGMPQPVDFSKVNENGWTAEDIESLVQCYPRAAEIEMIQAALHDSFPFADSVSRQIHLVSLTPTEALLEMTFVALEENADNACTLVIASMKDLQSRCREVDINRAGHEHRMQCCLI